MKYLSNGRPVTLAASQVLGVGGEATVFAVDGDPHRPEAAKVWHSPTPTQVRKVRALVAQKSSLPSALIAPTALLESPRGDVVGFLMPRLPAGFQPLALAMKRGTTSAGSGSGTGTNTGSPLADVLAALSSLASTLQMLHQRGVVVGDLSDQNVMVAGEAVRLIDVDSIQIDGLPCPVGTEATLDPTLYGVDLSKAPAFTEATDAYALAVLAFRVIFHVHPFGGVHPTLGTLPDRAAHGVSVFDKNVVYPSRVARPLHTLDEPSLELFRRVFDRGERPLLPATFFDALRVDLGSCATCRGTFSRGRALGGAICPACEASSRARRVPSPVSPLASPIPTPVGLLAHVLLEAPGEIVAAALTADSLVAVLVVQGKLTRRDTSRNADDVLTDERGIALTARSGDRLRVVVAPSGAVAVAICTPSAGDDVPLFFYPEGEPTDAPIVTTTRCFDKEPVFAFAGTKLLRLCSDMQMLADRRGNALVERAIGPALPGQTFLDPGPHPEGVVLGFTRVFHTVRFFRSDRGAQVDLAVSPLSFDASTHEVLEATAMLDDHGRTLVLRHTSAGGVPFTRFDLLDARGGLMASHRQRRDGSRLGTTHGLFGRLIKHGVVLHPTAHGVVREELRHGQTGPLTALDETAPHVTEASTLLAHPRGLVVLTGSTATLLERSTR